MDKSRKTLPLQNSIDKEIQYAFNFSDEQLEKEMDEAISNPDLSPELKAPDDEFLKIMCKIQARGIRAVELADEGSLKPMKVLSFKKLMRSLLVVAILGTLILAFGMSSVGKRAFNYRSEKDSVNSKNVKWDNVESVMVIDDVKLAYQRIRESVESNVLVLNYIPQNMSLVQIRFKPGYVEMKFLYNGNNIYVLQLDHATANSYGRSSDRNTIYKEVQNHWLSKTFSIIKNELDTKGVEYSTEFKNDETYYYISGIMDESEFIKILENLNFLY